MPKQSGAARRGYLKEDFRLFHLRDSRAQKLEDHYHEFNKLILPLAGRVTYLVEGAAYSLQPWDLLLVQRNLIHRAVIDPSEPYERVVLWLGRSWLKTRSDPGEPLETCFDAARQQGFHLLRTEGAQRKHYMETVRRLEEALDSREFGASRLADLLCQLLLIDLNRDFLPAVQARRGSCRVDETVDAILRYIAAHLEEELTVDRLAGQFYLSRYYLMHRFKEVTGCTLHQYIRQKRLLRARELLQEGVPVMKAAEQAGFLEYSTFLRAFQSTFHRSPRDFR